MNILKEFYFWAVFAFSFFIFSPQAFAQVVSEVIKTVPDCECYEVGSAEASQPANTTISYSSDSRITWSYVPQDDGTGKDCNVTDMRLSYNDEASSSEEDLGVEFIGTKTQTVVVPDGNGALELEALNISMTKALGSTLGDYAQGVSVDNSGNVFLTGVFRDTVDFDVTGGTDNHTSAGERDVFIAKYNADGSYGWTRTFGSALADYGYGVSNDGDGNVFVVGSFQGTVDFDATGSTDNRVSAGGADIFITKYNVDGSYGWTRTFGAASNDVGRGVSLDASGNVFFTGFFQGTVDFDDTGGTDNYISNGSGDIFIAKYNADGSYGWTRAIGSTGSDLGYGISVDSMGNAFAVGAFQATVDFDATGGTDNYTSVGSWDVFISKYNADGSYGFTRTFGAGSNDYGMSIFVDDSDSVLATGSFNGTVDFDATGGVDNHTSNGSDDAFIVKYNSNGSYGWGRTFGSTFFDYGYGISADKDGNVFTTGVFYNTVDFDDTGGTDSYTSAGSWDAFITKYNVDGSYGWTRAFGSTGSEYGYGVAVDSLGNSFSAGYFYGTVDFDATSGTDNHTSAGVGDIYLVGYENDGDYGSQIYSSLGTYQTNIVPSNVPTEWGTFTATQVVPVNTTLQYEVFDSTCTTSLITQTSSANIDLSSIDPNTYGELCLETTFETTNNQLTPSLDKWVAAFMLPTTNTDSTFNYLTQPDESCSPVLGEIAVEITDIKNITTNSMDLRVQVDNYTENTLDFKVKITNEETNQSDTEKFTEEVNDDGKATLNIEDLLPGTEYTFEVKVSEENQDDYSKYSDPESATTLADPVASPIVSFLSPVLNPSQNISPTTGEINTNQETIVNNQTPVPAFPGTTSQESLAERNNKDSKKSVLISKDAVKKIVDKNPVITSTTVATGLVAGAAAASAAATATVPFFPLAPGVFGKKFASLFSLLPILATSKKRFSIPIKRKKEEKYWGVVFDSFTKQPISEVLISLIDTEKRRIVDQTVSDENGRYGFLVAEDGEYELRINKGEYRIDIKKDKDSLYGDLYIIPQIFKKDSPVKLNIALDSQGFNWDQFARKVINQYNSLTAKAIKYILDIIYIAGFIFAIYAAVIYPSTINYMILFFYFIFLIYRIITKNKKAFGTVFSRETKKPLPFTVIELYDTITDQRINFTVSDILGRYYLLANNGDYKLKIKSMSSVDNPVNGEDRITVKSGILKEDFVL